MPLVCLALVLAALGASARADAALGVLRPEVEGPVEVLAPGAELWLMQQLAQAGLDPVRIEGAQALALETAERNAVPRALLMRLRERDGGVLVQLLVLAPKGPAIVASTRASAPLEDVGKALAEALRPLLGRLGAAGGAPRAATIDELACVSRALGLRARGDLYGAYRAVQGKLTPTAMALREEIVDSAWNGDLDPVARARVIAATGDPGAAWGLVGASARKALAQKQPDPALMVAAGDVSLARDDARQAQTYFEAAARHATGELAGSAHLGLARVAKRQENMDEAREALIRAAKLRPHDPRPLLEVARVETDPVRAARHMVEAGKRAARRLDVSRARRHYDRAMALAPEAAPRARNASAELEARLGRPAEALEIWAGQPADARDTNAQLGMARAYRALDDTPRARGAYQRLIRLEPGNADALEGLGALEVESGHNDAALTALRKAQQLAPDRRGTRSAIARALRAKGDLEGASAMLATLADEDASSEDLALLASVQLEGGNTQAARLSLDRAIAMDAYEPSLRAERARVLRLLGDPGADAEDTIAALLADGSTHGEPEPGTQSISGISLSALVETFAVQLPNAGRRAVASLGVREPPDWQSRVEQMIRPRSPDLLRIDEALMSGLEAHFASAVSAADGDPALAAYVDELFAFESDSSLSAHGIARMNGVLGTHAVVVTRVRAPLRETEASLCAPGDLEIEIRLLSGREPELASILANVECLAGGYAAFARGNPVAQGLYGLLALLVLLPFIRGWGTVHVSIALPDRTRGFFSIHITKKPDQVKRERVDKKTQRETTKSVRRLDVLRRFERHMAGRETPFRWIPARKAPYTVTVAGPLLDARGDEIIGHFFQEQPVKARRGAVTKVLFDFCPRECAVEVRLTETGRPAREARVAVRGDASSLRYASDGVAFLYLGTGRHTLVLGDHDTAAEITLEIHQLGTAIPVAIDFDDHHDVAFRGCPEAVEPFVQGDLAAAANALEAHGHTNSAHRIRASLLVDQGRAQDAAVALEAAGETLGAAELRAEGEDFSGSAELFERAGDFDRAADAYRAAGRLEEAGRCYEQVYDYPNAIECWREIGDAERELTLLEKIGEFMDAANMAHELGDPDRAIANLQQIDSRHMSYGDACRMIAEILQQRGEHGLAVAKFEEAMTSTGVENVSVATLEGYALALESADRPREAIAAYEAIARRDVNRGGVNERIERLRRQLESTEVAATTGQPQTASGPSESRYELLEEIGRGGMGVVFRARDTRLGRVVALKRLPDSLCDHPNAVMLFEREARAAAALNHVNIVTLFDADEENGRYFITMELLEGQPLNAILDRHGALSARDTARLGSQIASGLHYAHEQRIVHRDIKTSNLFFTQDQVVKIMDFGIAKSLEEVRRTTTVVGGTPYYMAPEQASGEAVDHRADLYALGVTFFQLVSGQLPFRDGDVTYLHRHEAPPDPREFDARIPARLAALILRLMEKRPEDRPEGAQHVGAELRSILGEIESGPSSPDATSD